MAWRLLERERENKGENDKWDERRKKTQTQHKKKKVTVFERYIVKKNPPLRSQPRESELFRPKSAAAVLHLVFSPEVFFCSSLVWRVLVTGGSIFVLHELM